jgi:hypothetical protein
MAKILCSKSGIQFKAEYFPIAFTSGELHHPIFYAPLKRLWKFYPKWQTGELGTVDSYLYFLALLNSTQLVQWRTAALRHADTDAIVQQYMEPLFSTIGHIAAIRNPRFILPRFVISTETRTLTNIKYWIQAWEESYSDFCNGLKDQDIRSQVQRREAALERLIKNPAIKPQRYAHLLAQWAALAGSFPTFSVTIAGVTQSCSDYWQDIICKCYNHVDIIQIPERDLVELLEHCEQEIELGSIYSYHLFNTLREGLETVRGFFGIGATTFSILSNDSDVGVSNLQLLIDSAPTEEPQRRDYATEFAFIKARMKWSLAVASATSATTTTTTTTTNKSLVEKL